MALSKLTDIRKSLSVEVEDLKVNGITTFTGSVSIGGTLTYQDVTNVDSVGIITARSTIDAQGDISIADKIIHTGDTNTAIRFPAADTITGETSGSERFRINSSGLVNIGAGSSASGLSPLLHLHKNASNSSAYFHITNNDTGITNNDGFLLGINPSGDCLVFNKDSTPIRFATAGTERFRIDSSGRMMIGTTAASTLASTDDLTISTSGSTGITLFSAAGNAGNITFGDGTSGDDRQRGLLQYHHLDNSMRFFTDAVRRMTIDSSGRLLAGTTDIGYNQFADNLTLADSANCGITLRSGTSNQGNIYFSDGTGTGADTYRGYITYAHADNIMLFATNSVERVRIKSDGKMGVNTNNPQEMLHVNGTTQSTDYKYTSHPGHTVFTGDNSTTSFTIQSGHSVNSILVVYNGAVLTPTTDYTVSGTTLSMNGFTPPTNAHICVRYLVK